MIWKVVLTIAAIYAVLVAFLFFYQPRLIYFPDVGREMGATPDRAGLAYETLRIPTPDGEHLAAWFVPAPGERGTVLFLHGNAGNISHRIDWLRLLHRLGYSTLIVEYRGYGRSTGSLSERGTYLDAQAAWDYLTTVRKVEPRDIVLMGESLGGAVAAWLTTQRRPRALVLVSAFTSIPDLGAQLYPYLPVRLLARFTYDTRSYLRQANCPVLIAHSEDDEIVPFAHGQSLLRAAPQPRQFLAMRGGHNEAFIFVREEWVSALAAFLETTRGVR